MSRKHGVIHIIGMAAIVIAAAFLVGCSSERSVPTLPGAHPDAWMENASVDFHGTVVLANGLDGCISCHGNDLDGGEVGVSCIDCHLGHTAMCLGCHGGSDNATGAPPIGLRGQTADTSLAVGAHTVHLDGGDLTDGYACATCHVVPVFLLDPPHLDMNTPAGQPLDSIAELVWGDLAAVNPAATWDRGSRTCENIYCHGGFGGGHEANAPVWTGANQAACGTCHDTGDDPADLGWKHEYHVATAELFCADCHAAVVDTNELIIDKSMHANGAINFLQRDESICEECHGPGAISCVACHGGTDNQTGAPPEGIDGETDVTDLAVGAHTRHLEGGSLAAGIACTTCHIVPQSLTAGGHLGDDGIAEIVWGGLAGTSAIWNHGSATCANTYCHGRFDGGNTTNAPVWTGSNQAACGSCHDVGDNTRTLSGRHYKHVVEEDLLCSRCHSATVDAGNAIVGIAVHVDGIKTVSFAPNPGNYTNQSCFGLGAGCHGVENWYDD